MSYTTLTINVMFEIGFPAVWFFLHLRSHGFSLIGSGLILIWWFNKSGLLFYI